MPSSKCERECQGIEEREPEVAHDGVSALESNFADLGSDFAPSESLENRWAHANQSQSFAERKGLEITVQTSSLDEKLQAPIESHSLRALVSPRLLNRDPDTSIESRSVPAYEDSTHQPDPSNTEPLLVRLRVEEMLKSMLSNSSGEEMQFPVADDLAALILSAPQTIVDALSSDSVLCEAFFVPAERKGSTDRVDLITFLLSLFDATVSDDKKKSLLSVISTVVRIVGLDLAHLRRLLSMLIVDGAWAKDAPALLQCLCEMTDAHLGLPRSSGSHNLPKAPPAVCDGARHFILDGESAGILLGTDDRSAWHQGYGVSMRIWWHALVCSGPIFKMECCAEDGSGKPQTLLDVSVSERGLAIAVDGGAPTQVAIGRRCPGWCSILISHSPPAARDQTAVMRVWVDATCHTLSVPYPSRMRAARQTPQGTSTTTPSSSNAGPPARGHAADQGQHVTMKGARGQGDVSTVLQREQEKGRDASRGRHGGESSEGGVAQKTAKQPAASTRACDVGDSRRWTSKVGEEVVLSGLKKNPQYNGMHGVVVDVDGPGSYLVVRTQFGGGSRSLRVRASNIAPSPHPAKHEPLGRLRVLAFVSDYDADSSRHAGACPEGPRYWKGLAGSVRVWNSADEDGGAAASDAPTRNPNLHFVARPGFLQPAAGALSTGTAQAIGNVRTGGHLTLSKALESVGELDVLLWLLAASVRVPSSVSTARACSGPSRGSGGFGASRRDSMRRSSFHRRERTVHTTSRRSSMSMLDALMPPAHRDARITLQVLELIAAMTSDPAMAERWQEQDRANRLLGCVSDALLAVRSGATEVEMAAFVKPVVAIIDNFSPRNRQPLKQSDACLSVSDCMIQHWVLCCRAWEGTGADSLFSIVDALCRWGAQETEGVCRLHEQGVLDVVLNTVIRPASTTDESERFTRSNSSPVELVVGMGARLCVPSDVASSGALHKAREAVLRMLCSRDGARKRTALGLALKVWYRQDAAQPEGSLDGVRSDKELAGRWLQTLVAMLAVDEGAVAQGMAVEVLVVVLRLLAWLPFADLQEWGEAGGYQLLLNGITGRRLLKEEQEGCYGALKVLVFGEAVQPKELVLANKNAGTRGLQGLGADSELSEHSRVDAHGVDADSEEQPPPTPRVSVSSDVEHLLGWHPRALKHALRAWRAFHAEVRTQTMTDLMGMVTGSPEGVKHLFAIPRWADMVMQLAVGRQEQECDGEEESRRVEQAGAIVGAVVKRNTQGRDGLLGFRDALAALFRCGVAAAQGNSLLLRSLEKCTDMVTLCALDGVAGACRQEGARTPGEERYRVWESLGGVLGCLLSVVVSNVAGERAGERSGGGEDGPDAASDSDTTLAIDCQFRPDEAPRWIRTLWTVYGPCFEHESWKGRKVAEKGVSLLASALKGDPASGGLTAAPAPSSPTSQTKKTPLRPKSTDKSAQRKTGAVQKQLQVVPGMWGESGCHVALMLCAHVLITSATAGTQLEDSEALHENEDRGKPALTIDDCCCVLSACASWLQNAKERRLAAVAPWLSWICKLSDAWRRHMARPVHQVLLLSRQHLALELDKVPLDEDVVRSGQATRRVLQLVDKGWWAAIVKQGSKVEEDDTSWHDEGDSLREALRKHWEREDAVREAHAQDAARRMRLVEGAATASRKEVLNALWTVKPLWGKPGGLGGWGRIEKNDGMGKFWGPEAAWRLDVAECGDGRQRRKLEWNPNARRHPNRHSQSIGRRSSSACSQAQTGRPWSGCDWSPTLPVEDVRQKWRASASFVMSQRELLFPTGMRPSPWRQHSGLEPHQPKYLGSEEEFPLGPRHTRQQSAPVLLGDSLAVHAYDPDVDGASQASFESDDDRAWKGLSAEEAECDAREHGAGGDSVLNGDEGEEDCTLRGFEREKSSFVAHKAEHGVVPDGVSHFQGLPEEAHRFAVRCALVTSGATVDGEILLGQTSMRFVPDKQQIRGDRDEPRRFHELSERVQEWPVASLSQIHGRRYLLQRTALELFFLHAPPVLFDFYNQRGRESAYKHLKAVALSLRSVKSLQKYSNFPKEKAIREVTEKWVQRRITNFEYLMALNTFAGRSYNDLSQYPVFPWVLSDYRSSKLDLNNPDSFRDLSRPIGAQTAATREKAQNLFYMLEQADPDTPPCHYLRHYSNPAYVLYYLLRLEPFTSLGVHLQGGSFDVADRLFTSMESAYAAATLEGTCSELTPEFFYLPDILVNGSHQDLGTTQEGKKVDNVELPPWADGSPHRFVALHRQALESEIVSAHLHKWIDLIFGQKQTGKPAVDALNVFEYATYEGGVDLDSLTQNDLTAQKMKIAEFGQTPIQLFSRPHPQRLPASSVAKPLWEDAGLLTEAPPIAGPSAGEHAHRMQSTTVRGGNEGKRDVLLAQWPDAETVVVVDAQGQIHSLSPQRMSPPTQTQKLSASALEILHKMGFGSLQKGESTSSLARSNPPSQLSEGTEQTLARFPHAYGGATPQNVCMMPMAKGCWSVISGGFEGGAVSVRSFRANGKLETEQTKTLLSNGSTVTSCALLAQAGEGPSLITGSQDGTVRIWRLGVKTQESRDGSSSSLWSLTDAPLTDRPSADLYCHDQDVTVLAVSERLSTVVSGSKDNSVAFIRATPGRYAHVRSIALPHRRPCEVGSPPTGDRQYGGVELLVVSDAGDVVGYSAQSQTLFGTDINGVELRQAPCGRLTSMVLAGEGAVLVTGSARGQVCIWNAGSLALLGQLPTQAEDPYPVRCLSFSPCRSALLVGYADGRLEMVTSATPPSKDSADPNNSTTKASSVSNCMSKANQARGRDSAAVLAATKLVRQGVVVDRAAQAAPTADAPAILEVTAAGLSPPSGD